MAMWARDLAVKVKGLSFDLDDTVWDCKAVLARAHAIRYETVKRDFPAMAAKWPTSDAFKDEFTADMAKAAEQDPSIAHNFTLKHHRALEIMGKECGLTPEQVVQPLFQAFAAHRTPTEDEGLFPDLPPALLGLKARGLVMSAVSNGNADPFKVPCLKANFEDLVNPDVCGCAKPDPRMFLKVVELRGGGAPGDWVHVGDSLQEDVAGARAAGLRAIWYNPKWDAAAEPPEAADAVVSSHSQLEAVLAKWAEALESTEAAERGAENGVKTPAEGSWKNMAQGLLK